MSVSTIRRAHGPEPMSDAAFDALVPKELRYLSAVHWTPVQVAVRAARWLAPTPQMRVLDVGCGVGKLCAIGALWTASAWYGVDHHRSNVVAAFELARTLGVSGRTCFLHADALSIDWTAFDAFYFYNPFEDAEQIAEVQRRLESLAPGTRVVTYHGFGGEMPASYACERHERIELGDLELFVQGDAR